MRSPVEPQLRRRQIWFAAADDKLELRPASAQEIEESLCFALRFAGRKRMHHADEVVARITAERRCSTSNGRATC